MHDNGREALRIKGHSMFLQQNLQALTQAHQSPPTWQNALLAIEATTDALLFTTEADDYTLQYQGVVLHDPQGASAEAQRTVLNTCRPSLDRVHLILGLGLGYVLAAAFEHSPGQIVVYEPDLPLLKFLLENVDFTPYLSSGRVRIATGLNELLNTLHPLLIGQDPLDIIAIPGYATLMANEVPTLMEALFALVEERLLDYRTGKHFHEQWIEQFFQNLPYFSHAQSFENLKSAFSGQPALLIGRGPSLDAAIEDVRTLAPKMTLIAVGGALHRLYQAGIVPDIAVFYDANGMQEQLHGLPSEYLQQIIFLLNPLTQRCCFTAPSKARVLFFPKHAEAFAAWLTQALRTQKKPLIVEGGGTVSLIALQAAMAMQCNPLVLIGQDLAFPNNQVYAGGIALQTDEQGRMNLERSENLYAAPEATTLVTGQNGDSLPALKAYASFIRQFERIAERNAGQENSYQLFNASIGGARLNGYALRPLHSFPDELTTAWKEDINLSLPDSPGQSAFASDDLRQAVTRFRNKLQQAIALHETILSQAEHSDTANRQLFDFLNENPLISHFLMFEMMETQRQYNPKPASQAEIEQNRMLLRQGSEHGRTMLRDCILPWVSRAEQLLLAEGIPASETPAIS